MILTAALFAGFPLAHADQPNAAGTANAASTGDIFSLLDAARIQRQISTTAFAARDPLLNDVGNRIDASEKLASSLESRAGSLDAVARVKFNSALSIAKARDADLKRSLEDARQAPAGLWEHARIMLANSYETYADAMELLSVESPPVAQK